MQLPVQVGGGALEGCGYVGQPVELWMQAHDSAGNAVTKGGDKVVVKVIGTPSNAPQPKITVRDEANGTYTIKLVPSSAGTYSLALMVGREQVRGQEYK